MPVTNTLIFFVSFITIVLVAILIFLIYFHRKTKVEINRFLSQSIGLKPKTIRNIRLRYWTTIGGRTIGSPNNYCDLYLFDNFLGIVRRQNFIFKVSFAPVLITPDIEQTKIIFSYLKAHKPRQIIFNHITKDEIDIKAIDLTRKNARLDITFKGLTEEQRNQLAKIKSWA